MLSRVNSIREAVTQMSRVFAISDVHVDLTDNLEWVKSLSQSNYQQDVLIVAGDVTDDMTLLEHTLQNLKQKFAEVCYVPG
jgi:predicted phosphodiesterase